MYVRSNIIFSRFLTTSKNFNRLIKKIQIFQLLINNLRFKMN